MKSDQQWSVRVKRRPHRDAVRRLRKAYGLLGRMSSTSAPAESNEKTEELTRFAQEVRK